MGRYNKEKQVSETKLADLLSFNDDMYPLISTISSKPKGEQ